MLSYAFCILLLGVFATCDKTPNYLQAQIDVNDALSVLHEQISSMDGHIPLLNDNRRHYAEIIHAIFNLADSQSGCLRLPYNQYYQSNINKYVPEAVKNPQVVLDEVRKQTELLFNATKTIQGVIKHECFPVGYGSYSGSSHRCDEKVQERVDFKYFPKQQATILLAAGKAANSFLARHEEFLAASKTYNTKAYLIYGASILKQVVFDIADYLRALRANELGFSQC